MKEIRQTICDRCRKSVPVSDIRYIAIGENSNIIVCPSCRDKINTQKTSPQKNTTQKILYMCERCNYKFRYNPEGVSNLNCPSCGKNDRLIEYKALSADNLIKSVEE